MIKEILKLADDAQQGLSDPLRSYIELKRIEKVLENCMKVVQPLAVQDAYKYPEKIIEMEGVNVQKGKAAGKWDYSTNPLYAQKKQELKELEEMGKEAYKAAQKDRTVVDGDGVVVPPALYTEGAENITIKFKENYDTRGNY